MQFCFVIIPIIQVFFVYFDTVTTEVSLRLSVLWDFFIFYTLLLIVLIANLVALIIMFFVVSTLVTHRIINFRLAPASASLRLMRSLRIYYSMLWGACILLISNSLQIRGLIGTLTFDTSFPNLGGFWTVYVATLVTPRIINFRSAPRLLFYSDILL